jgi:hypothetical protein
VCSSNRSAFHVPPVPRSTTLAAALLALLCDGFAPAAVEAACEAQPSAAKWCPATSISWSFGQGLTGTLTGAALTIKTEVLLAINDLNNTFAADKVPVHFNGPAGTPGTGLTITFGATELGTWTCATPNAVYAETYNEYSYTPGNAIGRVTRSSMDFNSKFSGWTGVLALQTAYHELGHALGLYHFFNSGAACSPTVTMSEIYSCTFAGGQDALFTKGIHCLYGPDGVSSRASSSRTRSAADEDRTSGCSGSSACTAINGQGVLTYDLAISEDDGPFVSFATLNEGDWVDNAYEHEFPRSYTNARVRMEVRDGATILSSPTSNAIDIPAPLTAVEPTGRGGLSLTATPNPFRNRTRIGITLADAGPARVTVIDAAGRRVHLLYEGPLEAGSHEFSWDGRNDAGVPAASGVYLIQAKVAGARVTRTVLRLP